MNKVLKIINFFLFTILLGLNIYFIFTRESSINVENVLGQSIYLILLVSLIVLTLKDTIKKEIINKNNTYQIITIIVLVIMNIVLCRLLFDSNLFFNNKDFINEINDYSMLFYNTKNGLDFNEYSIYYYCQNMIYFNVMLLLLFIYRNINLRTKYN